jgi:hypothetical protein
MENETLKQLFEFADKSGDNPQWLNADSFVLKTVLDKDEYITSQIIQDGETIIHQVPFHTISSVSPEAKLSLLEQLLALNHNSEVITMLIDEEIYLKISHPVTYQPRLDTMLFIQARHAIARFYEEKRASFFPVES